MDLYEIHRMWIVRDGEVAPEEIITNSDKISKKNQDGTEVLLNNDNIKFLVFGLPEGKPQTASTKEEVNIFLSEKYDGAKIDFNKLTINNGVVTVEKNLLKSEDWYKIKKDGNLGIPYRITILIGDDKTFKPYKIAMYGDGTASLENLDQ